MISSLLVPCSDPVEAIGSVVPPGTASTMPVLPAQQSTPTALVVHRHSAARARRVIRHLGSNAATRPGCPDPSVPRQARQHLELASSPA